MLREVKRIEQISANTVLASSGEFSDFQEVVLKLGKINKQALQYDDGVKPTPRDFGNYLARISYQMRCKINPYYLQNVVAVCFRGTLGSQQRRAVPGHRRPLRHLPRAQVGSYRLRQLLLQAHYHQLLE